MSEYTVGAAVLDIFSSSLYKTSWSIFREYIQNSCDSIDDAEKSGLLAEGEGLINIFIDKENRKIVIEDNATGIKADNFAKVLGSIAASGKDPTTHKGFIGIGRLIGLGCCETVTFTAKSKGERIISKLTCDSDLMRELFTSNTKFSVDDVLKQINKFSQEFTSDIESHYFIVELDEIKSDHDYLLDVESVKKSLEFVVPLPYAYTFHEFSTQIHEHAREIGYKIDEYKIFLNDEQVFKPYYTIFPTGSDEDTIRKIQFWDIRDKNNNLFAWIWYGISSFKGVIKENCPMRGIRLRKENIQIGPDDVMQMQKLFPEDRGNHFFIGELFCVSKALIPTTPRDYFVENPARIALEKYLRTFFENNLSKFYRVASVIRSSLKKIDEQEKIIDENQERLNDGLYHDNERKLELEAEIIKAETEIAKRKAAISKYKSSSETISDIADYIEIELSNSDKDRGFTLTKYGKRVLNKVFGIILDEFGTGNHTKQLIASIKEKLNYK